MQTSGGGCVNDEFGPYVAFRLRADNDLSRIDWLSADSGLTIPA
jgi:hypothetical protein